MPPPELISPDPCTATRPNPQPPLGGREPPYWKRCRQTRACLCQLCAKLPTSGGRGAEQVSLAVGGVRERLREAQALVRLVFGPRVRDLERMRGRRHVRQVELGHLGD